MAKDDKMADDRDPVEMELTAAMFVSERGYRNADHIHTLTGQVLVEARVEYLKHRDAYVDYMIESGLPEDVVNAAIEKAIR